MTPARFYPVGRPGHAWNAGELAEWRSRQSRLRRYDVDIVQRIDALADEYDLIPYGELRYDDECFALLALGGRQIRPELPSVLVTGGVHGYETSGVLGVLEFLENEAADYLEKINLLAIPCVSPWGYERIARWNHDAVDPNRSFQAAGLAGEADALRDLVASTPSPYLLHIDLHETTDSDEAEFDPALAARDGKAFVPDPVPDGFYLVADRANPQLAFQQAIIAAVEAVTHIAPPDAKGEIIGARAVAHGVIEFPVRDFGLCTSITGAPYTTTTEVYPDSPRTSPQACIRAQVTAIRAALDFALAMS